MLAGWQLAADGQAPRVEQAPAWSPARLAAVRAAHVSLHIAETLADRPLSVANTPFVVNSLRALATLRQVLIDAIAGLNGCDRRQVTTLIEMISGFLVEPGPPGARQIARYVSEAMELHAAAMRASIPQRELSAEPFRGSHHDSLVVMIGPGIGIGDEIKLQALLLGLRCGLELDPAQVAIFSFYPSIWRTLTPDFVVHDLSRDPLGAFSEARQRRHPLLVFASFLEQFSARCTMPVGQPTDTMAVTLINGEIRLRFANDGVERVISTLVRKAPNYKAALAALTEHVCPSEAATASGLPRPSITRLRNDRRTFTLAISPFTSKTSPLTPFDWAGFVAVVRRALPPSRCLSCWIVPGVSQSCREFAEQTRTLTRARLHGEDAVALLDDGRTPLGVDDAFPALFDALRDTDLLLSIDTFSAHLARQTGTVTVALCLNRNVHFWDVTPYSFWLDTTRPRRDVITLLRVISSLAARTTTRGGPLADLLDRAPRLIRATAGLASPDQGRAAMVSLRRRGDALWVALPDAIRQALMSLDAEYAWPGLRHDIVSEDPGRRRVAWMQLSASTFWRMSWLAALVCEGQS